MRADAMVVREGHAPCMMPAGRTTTLLRCLEMSKLVVSASDQWSTTLCAVRLCLLLPVFSAQKHSESLVYRSLRVLDLHAFMLTFRWR